MTLIYWLLMSLLGTANRRKYVYILTCTCIGVVIPTVIYPFYLLDDFFEQKELAFWIMVISAGIGAIFVLFYLGNVIKEFI